MKNKVIFFLFFILLADIFAVSPTEKNANRAKRYYATLERVVENLEYEDVSDFSEICFAIGRIGHFVEVLKPVFEDLYDNGVAGIYLYDVEIIEGIYEGWLREYKPLVEMIFYNFDSYLLQMLREDGSIPRNLKNLPNDELLNLPLGELVEEDFGDGFDFDEIGEFFPGMSYNELVNLSLRDFFQVILLSDAMKVEAGFDINEAKAAYEKGLAYDKIEFE